jgi:hypothetical protein
MELETVYIPRIKNPNIKILSFYLVELESEGGEVLRGEEQKRFNAF